MDERQAAIERLKAQAEEATEKEIDVEVEAERERQRRAAADAAERQRLAKARAELSKEFDTWMRNLAEAEAGAVQMASSIREAFATANRINAAAAALGNKSRLFPRDLADRLTKRLSLLLAGIDGPHNFGAFTLDTFMIDPKEPWPAGERRHAGWVEAIALAHKGDLK
jgi:hypothetical protein